MFRDELPNDLAEDEVKGDYEPLNSNLVCKFIIKMQFGLCCNKICLYPFYLHSVRKNLFMAQTDVHLRLRLSTSGF